MAASRADNHDRDKMERWRHGLLGENETGFPVCAIFLVSRDDQLSHDIFRKYRDSFEGMNAGFHHLTIFGQHGISTAVTGFLDRFNLPLESLPYLVMAPAVGAREFSIINLPSGGHPGPSPALEREHNRNEPWQLVLDRVEAAVDQGSRSVDLSEVSGAVTFQLNGESLTDLVNGLLAAA